MNTIFLRAFESDDYILINKWRNDPEIQKLTGGTFRYVSLEMEKQWVHDKMMNNTKDIYLAICLNDESRRMIGYTSLNNIDYINRSVFGGGVIIGDKEYRDGFALFERALLLMSYVFDELNMHRLYGSCLEDHKTSRSMLYALNYTCEGMEREAVYKHGKYHNRMMYSILADEYRRSLDNGEFQMNSIIKRFVKFAKEIK